MRLALIGGTVALLAAMLASPAAAETLEAETQAANVGSYSATLNGKVFKQFKSPTALAGYRFGLTSSYGTEIEAANLTGQNGSISIPATVEGLQPNTIYHFQAGIAGPWGEEVFGKDMTFETAPKAKFTAAKLPASLKLEEDTGNPLTFGIEGGTFSCESLSASATITLADVMFGRSSEVALVPSFSGCSALGIGVSSVKANGCSLVLRAGDSGTATGGMGVSCPEGAAIEVSMGNCAFSLTSQTGVGPISETVETNTIDVQADATGVDYVKTKDGQLCPFNGTGAKSDGTLKGGATLSGTNEGSPTAVSIIH